MPLVRVQVRNEYGLGTPELYTDTNREDPKAVLDGVAVAGLVGILRQLGDLAEFAAEVFHGLQEQVLITSSRSHKMVQRVHAVEAALPPLEKAILAQRSHLHFAYTAGSHWHTRVRTEHNHFIYSDLPRCVMEPYEDCRDPPRLSKLDKFDIGGPGSCFKRYSDPTYFKRSSVGPYEAHLQTVSREKKARRNKKKRSSSRYRDVTHDTPVIMHGGRTDFGSVNLEEKASASQDALQKPVIDLEVDHLTSFDSKNGSGYIECIFRPSCSTQSEDNNAKESSSDSNVQHNSYLDKFDSVSLDENINNGYLLDDNKSKSAYITWDEKLEIIDSTKQPNESTEVPCTTDEKENLSNGVVDDVDFDFQDEQEQPDLIPVIVRGQHDEIESETDYYMDALNTIESESENDLDCHTKQELKRCSDVDNQRLDFENKETQIDDISMDFEFHVPENTYLTPMPISLEAHAEANGSSSIENHQVERVVTNAVIVASYREPSPQPMVNEPMITHKSIEPSGSTSGGQTIVSNPVMFWTNGGLLGLEPSKPPDFGLPAATSPEPVEEAKTAINDVKPESSGQLPGADDPITSSRVFEFSNRLLANGFRKQISLVGNETLANSVKTDVPENPTVHKGYPTVTGIPFREQFGNGHPLISPSSPPLEHMRISFQPIDGFQTSKLKLAFPDVNNNNNNGHMFPSFQLVPEAVSLHEFDSDFDDDDTFCRSSPYESDHPSESNSEQWDSSESPRLKDHELDDAFGRISSAESVSTSQVNGIRFQSSTHGLLFDIPNLDTVKASQNQVTNDLKGPTPPPPLPPMEWRGTGIKPNLDDLSETLTYTLNLTPTQPTPPQEPKPAPRNLKPTPPTPPQVPKPATRNLKPTQPTPPLEPKPAPRKQENVVETDSIKVKPKPDWWNLHAQNGSTHIINGKFGDEREDFLQQIRNKSRNLRRISTAPPTTTPAGPTSINVTAILEKASAIRQVVGSDDGEDNWSDS
ncbi:protein SCAR1-like [Bidens hawaiensis]|uniref:protein SCAR1-like n=1 Tax=Bidens hawaiensis TaxID=980011 RepID=UPI00404A27EA